jgi:hypothetical protein
VKKLKHAVAYPVIIHDDEIPEECRWPVRLSHLPGDEGEAEHDALSYEEA